MRAYFGFFLMAIGLAGCGGAGGPALYDVRGKLVWDDDKPIPDVVVTFSPTEKGLPSSAGRTNATGDFVLTTSSGQLGVPKGKFKVFVTISKPSGSGAPSTDAMVDMYKNPQKGGPKTDNAVGVPNEYTAADKTPLELEVTGKQSGLSIMIPRAK